MALNKITWTNKTTLDPQPSIARENKCTDAYLNEIKTVVNDAIDQVDTNTTKIGHISPVLLWTNPSPSSSFTGQINVDFSNVDAYQIIWATSTSGVVKDCTGIIPVGSRTELYTTYYDNAIKLRYRQVTAITSSTITFGDASENGNTNNGACIPLYIIGYKTGLF